MPEDSRGTLFSIGTILHCLRRTWNNRAYKMEAQLRNILKMASMEPSECNEIDLEDCELTAILASDLKYLNENFKNVVSINFGENQIKKIDGVFNNMPILSLLDLRENKLTSDVLGSLTKLTGLEVLMLTNNLIKTVDKFSLLKSLDKLNFLSLEGCPVTDLVPDYRQKIFVMLPNLQIIDFEDRDGNKIERPDEGEVEEAGDLAAFYNSKYDDNDDEEEDDEVDVNDLGEEDDEDFDDDEEEEDLPPQPKKSRL
jgi:Leucine-rich repeat